ncbi:alkaline phosphatase [Chitinophaga sp. LS1]|uniref:alkaline phosphatase n=1 Tax=Chitinophaga sp. LS1 TaxID=3051176 RepID=UPI002AAC4D2E|nr:alkaline phosphatase [Chitinophaga sp. LS1]WPV64596.1 alkaline phosphatase [Chitinophaga sp. LS1]
MRRRDFFRNTSITLLGSSFFPIHKLQAKNYPPKTARNIIFMVSDGMSIGTLNLASLLLQRKEGRQSHWLSLYEEEKVSRALMDTASLSSLITDSAAASSAWGGGVRVKNGKLNVSEDGTHHTPILQKFKAAGKAVGCVTTVPITHATPAGFSVTNASRGDMHEIAEQYLPLKFDVMMGGGREYFPPGLLARYEATGYTVVKNRDQMLQLNKTPALGIFNENGLPYALDHIQDITLQQNIPTLAEMSKTAIELLNKNKQGFVLQIEGGKVDWAAHANDAGALIYDQIAFDNAIKVAIDFASKDGNTMVIITTDHGNSNPGLFYGDNANQQFDKLQHYRYTNEWILNVVNKSFTPAQLIERIEAAQGIAITKEEAASILVHYEQLDEAGVYNPRKLPFRQLAAIQSSYTSIGWGAMDHSADYVELAIYGPGRDLIKPFIKNTDLHYLMLQATGIKNN